MAIAWTGGKDSTVLLHLIREFLPADAHFRVLLNDSTIEFKEIYQFIKKIVNQWKIDLIWLKHDESDLRLYHHAHTQEEKMEVPYVNLYDRGYKSLGEEPFTKPVKDIHTPERAGREATKEKVMSRLRSLGYW